ncbi:TPM domain-containing protein [Nitratidesulfovibrio liaohensis]|uniref:TPM domain-containing protein n=1 Tax=Nitratidesulfovibrio liaohensis TaxID=2604158 RepID=UPI001420701F|nr:TPM domain-containing protein [Nitratidesulfovibrio liaohensis]NHZ48193.1 TPM domain-containing protein [Nitratidesulfovibrio liaohensis]
MFLRFPKRDRAEPRLPLVNADTPGQFFLRTMLLIAVFALTAWAFWANTERRLADVRAASAVWDEADLLTDAQEKALRELVDAFREVHGVKLLIHIRRDTPELPRLDAQTLFVGLCPAKGQAIVELPPLLRKAYGETLAQTLENDWLRPAMASGQWAEGLVRTLKHLWDRLGEN